MQERRELRCHDLSNAADLVDLESPSLPDSPDNARLSPLGLEDEHTITKLRTARIE
jgi:hypothetical protein